jgi:hypothetical protein
MRINPTFTAANKVVTFAWIPRQRFLNCIQLAVLTLAIFGSFKAMGIVGGVAWLGFFIAYLRDPAYMKLLWRSLRRSPVCSPVLAATGDRKRIQNG